MGAHFLSLPLSFCPSVSPSLCPSVLLSFYLCVSVSLWHGLSSKVVRFDLEVELRPELNNARRIRRREAKELARRVLRTARDANVRKPKLIEEERAAGDVIHILEVGPVEEIEG